VKIKCPGCGYEVFKRISIEPVSIEYDEETGDLTDADPEVPCNECTIPMPCDAENLGQCAEKRGAEIPVDHLHIDLVSVPQKADDCYDYAYKCVKCNRPLSETEMIPPKYRAKP
jgi:DNA-directed RNA polymerase subunit RPC12/RpoP